MPDEIQTANHKQIPFLRIIKPLSLEINKTDPEFIKGASAGDLFNTVTGQTWDGEEGVTVIWISWPENFIRSNPRMLSCLN
ncbi:hypothetical protein AB8880_11305 [Alphaproteobacteria bacterium LSUCC0684]